MADGCPLVMLPGSLCDARLFGAQLGALRRRSVQVGNIGVADRVSSIAAAVLRSAPARFALAGLSMGGIVAFEIWRQAPQRVAGLALLDTTCAVEAPGIAERRLEEMERVRRDGTAGLRRLVRETYLPLYFASAGAGSQRLRDLIVQMATACGPNVLLRQWSALMNRPDSRVTLSTIDCPALVLCGSGDRLCPPDAHQEMAAVIGVDCHVLDGCGHFPSLEAPARTTALLGGWLESVDVLELATGSSRHGVAC